MEKPSGFETGGEANGEWRRDAPFDQKPATGRSGDSYLDLSDQSMCDQHVES